MSLLHRRTARISLTALAVVGLGLGVPLIQASANPSPTAACLDAGNVWVLVQTDDAVDGGCAEEFGTGLEALSSAGFEVDIDDTGFINRIDGVPAVKGPQDWWAYAHTDADLAAWEFYEVGALESEPAPGSIEAWRLIHSYDDTDTFPSITPGELLADVAATPTPSPSVSTEPSTTATSSPSPEPSGSPSMSVAPSATATSTTSPVRPGLPHTGN